MNTIGLPDILSAGRLSRDLARVDEAFGRASAEISSGLKADLVEATGGDPARLYAIERDIALATRRGDALSLAAGRAGGAQIALTRVQNAASDIGVELAAAAARGDFRAADAQAAKARSAFGDAVDALNSRFADRSLFAGAAVDVPALADADVILAEIAALTAAAPDAATAEAAVDAYFADPAGFDATAYLGSDVDVPAVEAGQNLRTSFAIRADNAAVKDALAAIALAVVGAEGAFAGGAATNAARLDLLGAASGRSFAAVEGVVTLRSALGVAEERIDLSAVRVEAEASALEIARSDLRSANPFEAATAFTALETQLQSIFAITARLSNLTLSSFLR